MKQFITLYIHQIPGEPQRALTVDMSDWPEFFGAMLGTYTVEVEWQELDRDPTVTLIEHYEHQIEREAGEFHDRLNVLAGKVSRLMNFEDESEEEPQ